MLYNHVAVDKLLGCMILDTSLANSDKYKLEKTDFDGCQLHKILYSTLYNLSLKGNKSPTPSDIDLYIAPWTAQYNVFKDNGGLDYVNTIVQLVSLDNFEYYYDSVRKMSLLRDYKDSGFDIKEFWDIDKSDDANYKNIEGYKTSDIVNHFSLIQSDIKAKYDTTIKYTEMICGDGFDDLLDELEEAPLVGAGLCSPMLNELFRGWCKGHLILRGAPSSFGKTLFGLADALNVSCLKIWSEEDNDFIDNPYYQGMGAYIHTEQNSKTDIQTRACSILARIDYGTLRNGAYTKEQKERLSKAGKILKESKFKLMYYPDFTMTGMREIVERLSLQGYEYITKDYIWNNSWIISDIKKTMGITNTSEPNALMQYANSLKNIAEEFNVGIATMMQLNGKEKEVELVDEGCLYASRAVKTKLDNGSIMKTPTQKELKSCEPFILNWNKKHNGVAFGDGSILYPNAVNHCFKTRYGGHGENVKVFQLVNKSTGETTDMFATTWDNKPLTDPITQKPYELPKLYIENNNK